MRNSNFFNENYTILHSKNQMKHITLSNGVQMPILGYGTAGLKGEQAYNCVKEALKIGYRMID